MIRDAKAARIARAKEAGEAKVKEAVDAKKADEANAVSTPRKRRSVRAPAAKGVVINETPVPPPKPTAVIGKGKEIVVDEGKAPSDKQTIIELIMDDIEEKTQECLALFDG